MPLYDVINKKTQEISTFWGSFSALQEHLNENGLQQHFVANQYLDAANYGNVSTKQQPSDDFKTRIRQINKNHHIDTKNQMNW